ncbi:MAG: hypothetical protein K1X94_24755 [Sandaracinaceae bacterium]|nr:hypothetical protein [Sandaracinaceae bacterium]
MASTRRTEVGAGRVGVLGGLSLLALISSCAARGPTVVVSVVTDLAAGKDFVGVRVELGQGLDVLEERERVAALGSWVTPHQVAVFDDVPEGTLRVRASLLAVGGETLIAREMIDTHTGDRAINVILESSCFGVTCARDGDAPATECRGGRCVEPCADCPPQCVAATDCPPSDACGAPECVLGTCIYPEGADRCPPGQLCHPTRGCVPTTVVVGCVVDEDCPAPVLGSWSSCDAAATCATTGDRARDRTTFTCVGGRCAPTTAIEHEACARDTDGTPCGTDGCSDWTECGFAECVSTGARYRTCSSPSCAGGVCDGHDREQMEPCTRGPQDGLPCMVNTGYGYCGGTCAGTTCSDLCADCPGGGFCAESGCYLSGGGGRCP